jgi:hypothetical protein
MALPGHTAANRLGEASVDRTRHIRAVPIQPTLEAINRPAGALRRRIDRHSGRRLTDPELLVTARCKVRALRLDRAPDTPSRASAWLSDQPPARTAIASQPEPPSERPTRSCCSRANPFGGTAILRTFVVWPSRVNFLPPSGALDIERRASGVPRSACCGANATRSETTPPAESVQVSYLLDGLRGVISHKPAVSPLRHAGLLQVSQFRLTERGPRLLDAFEGDPGLPGSPSNGFA